MTNPRPIAVIANPETAANVSKGEIRMPLSEEGIEKIAKAIVATQEERRHDHKHDGHDDHDDDEHRGRNQWRPPEWLKYVTPIVFICLGFAWNNMKSSTIADRQEIKVVSDKIDVLETRLPLDYVPRAEHARNAEIDRALTKEREDRVTRIESTVNRILENQESRKQTK